MRLPYLDDERSLEGKAAEKRLKRGTLWIIIMFKGDD